MDRMQQNDLLEAQGRRLLQVGMLLILFTCFWGFAIPALASTRIGLSVHTLSGFEGVFLLAQGLLWPKLRLGRGAASTAFFCSLFGTFAILAAYVVAATTGFGLETIALMGELPHGLARGAFWQETIVKVLAYASAPTGIAAYGLILYGLAGPAKGASPKV